LRLSPPCDCQCNNSELERENERLLRHGVTANE
jgi:hypothetical protein